MAYPLRALADAPRLDGVRVLVVDDAALVLEVVTEILRRVDAIVTAVGSARAAPQALRSEPPDVLLSDIAMPGEDGYWLIDRVRALPADAGGATAAIALTAHGGLEAYARVLRAGFQAHLAKPVGMRELVSTVAALNRSHLADRSLVKGHPAGPLSQGERAAAHRRCFFCACRARISVSDGAPYVSRLPGPISSGHEQGSRMSMKRNAKPRLDTRTLSAAIGTGLTTRAYRRAQRIFAQGDRADTVFFVQQGKVKVTVLSPQGKQAVIALLGPGDFFGEGCLAGQPLRMATATAMTECSIARLAKPKMIQVLHEDSAFAEVFTTYLLSRNIRMEEDLVDQLFNSSEKRLARVLLLLANFGKEGRPEPVVPRISQETLAEMVGTTRSRISHFMNKFRRLGFVEYNGGLQVHTSLLHVVLHD